MRFERGTTVIPPLALTVELKQEATQVEAGESGRRGKVSSEVVEEQSGAGQAAETGGSQRRRSCLPEGSDDSAEDCGAKQTLYAAGRYDRNADSVCVHEGTDRSPEPTLRSESRASLLSLPSREEERANGPNSESGHKHPDRDTSGRVCDWSDDVRNEHRSGKNSLAWRRALGRCVGNGADTEQERKACGDGDERQRGGVRTDLKRMCSGSGMEHTSGEDLASILKSPFGGAGG